MRSWNVISRSTAAAHADTGSAFEEFFLEQHERLFQALFLLTGDRAEADDLAQEALLRAYERWDRVRHGFAGRIRLPNGT